VTSTLETLDRLAGYENFQSWTRPHPADWAEAEARVVETATGRILPEYPLGEGPWNDEPDKVQWIDPITGLDCLIVRNRMGALCGYVGLPPEHPLHGKDYGHDAVDVSVHGGLTFANFCADEEGPDAICHIAAPGRPDHVWWLGFDCGHAWDLQPGMVQFEKRMGFGRLPDVVYRDLDYVVDEVTALAVQLVHAEAS